MSNAVKTNKRILALYGNPISIEKRQSDRETN